MGNKIYLIDKQGNDTLGTAQSYDSEKHTLAVVDHFGITREIDENDIAFVTILWLQQYDGKYVRIISPDNCIYECFVDEYVYPDDQPDEIGPKEGIIIKCDKGPSLVGKLIEFNPDHIAHIEIINRPPKQLRNKK